MNQSHTPRPLTLDHLQSLNPHLTIADILALWHWSGPSRRLH